VDLDRKASAQSPCQLLSEIGLLRGVEFARQLGRVGLRRFFGALHFVELRDEGSARIRSGNHLTRLG